jgi:hypothetical protein
MTIAELAQRISQAPSEATKWRLIAEFLEEFNHEPSEARQRLLDAVPGDTDDERFDLYLAALCEHLAYHNDLNNPPWVLTPRRVWVGRVWFPNDLPSAKVWALSQSPAAFRRRGIFIHPDDLSRA